jgi:hypothetical protein
MRNKAKFQKSKNELNPLYDKGIRKKTGDFDNAKTKPNKPKSKPKFTCHKGCKAKSNPNQTQFMVSLSNQQTQNKAKVPLNSNFQNVQYHYGKIFRE